MTSSAGQMPAASKRRYDAVLFDLLSALLDSWTLWTNIAGDIEIAFRWRERCLDLTQEAGEYAPYEFFVAEAAAEQGLDPLLPRRLLDQWHELRPWPEAPTVLSTIVAAGVRIGVVTNCSVNLGQVAAGLVGVPFDVVITAEEAGAYKPRPEPFRRALEVLGLPPERVLFVAGSRRDIAGAGGVGMTTWWHNRLALPPDPENAPVAEHRSLDPLPDFLAAGGERSS